MKPSDERDKNHHDPLKVIDEILIWFWSQKSNQKTSKHAVLLSFVCKPNLCVFLTEIQLHVMIIEMMNCLIYKLSKNKDAYLLSQLNSTKSRWSLVYDYLKLELTSLSDILDK